MTGRAEYMYSFVAGNKGDKNSAEFTRLEYDNNPIIKMILDHGK